MMRPSSPTSLAARCSVKAAPLVLTPKTRSKSASLKSVTASSTYLATKVTSSFQNFSILGNPVNFQGDRFPYTPAWQLVANGEYRFPIANSRSLFVSGNANYRGATTSGICGD